MLPSLSSAMPHGLLNSPSPLPALPHLATNLPSGVKTCRRLLPLSTTIRLPFASQTMPAGPFSSPGPLPGLPHLRMNLPFASKTDMVFFHSSGHVDVAVLADGDAERPNAVLVLLAVGCEFSQQLLFAGTADFDVVDAHAEIVLVAAIGDIDVAVVAQAHGLRIVESGAVRRAASDGVAPIVDSSLDVCRQRHCPLPSH